MGSKKKQTIGYRYFFGTHMGIGLAVDELVEIEVGDRKAWTGSITDNTSIEINKPMLFGGDEKEGGIVGTLSVLMGRAGQSVHPALAAMLGGLVPAFRGAATLFFDGLMCSGSPYPKPWRFRVRRATTGWEGDTWYPEKAVVWMGGGTVRAMNPAHILYECWTNSEWGRGADASRLHDARWRAAADKLHAEGFGLCFKWSRTDSIESFMQQVVDHIGAAQYVDPDSAKVVLELIRDDYTPESLPIYTPDTGLLGIDDDSTGSQPAATNEVIVRWRDPLTRTDRSTRVKNPGAIHAGNGVGTATKDYPGIPTADLARRVAMRDLRSASGFIKRFKVRLDRRAYQLAPGKVFRVSDPKRGIVNMVLRAGRVEKGSLSAGTITITALQDVFGLPSTTYAGVQPPGWTPPNTTPQPVTLSRLIEVPYRELVQVTDAANMALIDDTAGYAVALAVKPTAMSMDFNLLTRVGTSGAFTSKVPSEAFCPSSTLVGALSRAAVSAVVLPGVDLRQVAVGSAALIGEEIVRVVAINSDTGSVTLARGCADTVPAEHADGTRVWFYDDFASGDPTEYSTGVTVQARLLTHTSAGELAEGSAATISAVMSQRQARPYPPGNVRVNGVSYPSTVTGEVTVMWAHRDRIIQGDQLIDTTAGSIGPEPGTSYRLRIYSGTTLRRTYSGLTGTSQTYTAAHESADGGPFNPVRLVLDSVRDGLYSRQMHDITVGRS